MSTGKLLLIDVGNTNTKLGLADGDELIASYTLPTRHEDTPDAWGLKIEEICRRHRIAVRDLSAWAVCSVAPQIDPVLSRAAEKYSGVKAVFVPNGLPVGLENRYERPHEVGADRLVTAYAAHCLYPSPAHVIIDFGTATTFDCVKDGAYLGGLICPGVLSSARALATQTAKLPQITLDLTNGGDMHIGKSTFDSLNQGLVFGFAAMVEGLCLKLQKILDAPTRVTATGGLAENIAKVCPCIEQTNPDLLLLGLLKIYRENF